MNTILHGIAGCALSACMTTSASATNFPCKNHYILEPQDPCLSSPGTPDPAFGDKGLVPLNAGFNAAATGIQADGRIVVAGSRIVSTSVATTQFTLVRLTPDGLPDPTFGDGGQVVAFASAAGGALSSVVIQPDGKILTGGTAWIHRDPNYYKSTAAMSLLRFLPDGTLDTTFGESGRITAPAGPSSLLDALLVQPDGGIVALVQVCEDGLTQCRSALQRYNAGGIPVTTFGSGGVVSFERSSGQGLALQADGKLLAAYSYQIVAGVSVSCKSNQRGGLDCTCTGPAEFHCPPTLQESVQNTANRLIRFNSDGSPDHSFGTDGIVSIPFAAAAILAAADGKVIIAGQSLLADPNYLRLSIARYTAQGSLDATFGKEGITTGLLPGGIELQSRSAEDWPLGVVERPDHKLVVVADRTDGTDWSDVLAARYSPDGLLDRTFNEQGYAHTLRTGLDTPIDFKLLADGKLLVVADVFGNGNVLLRYRGDEAIEFFHTTLGKYFLTADPAEQASVLSGGSGAGWALTGESFKYNGGTRVCRFVSAVSGDSASHFYTIDPLECERVKSDAGWRFESYDFAAVPPDGGQCAAPTVPVFRTYNNSFPSQSNHRYVTDEATYRSMIADGWAGEGVAFCAVQ